MHSLFNFDSFISHIHELFCSNVVKGIKCTVVPEIHFALFSAATTENSIFSLLQSPFFADSQARTSSQALFLKSQTALLFLSLSGKGEKGKRKKLELLLRSGVKAFLALHHVMCPLFPLLWGRSQDCLPVGAKSPAFPGVRSLNCLNS